MFHNIRNLLAKLSTSISPVGSEVTVSNDVLHTGKWPTPEPFNTELTPVLPFSADLLPEPLGRHVLSYAKRLDHAPVEYAAISVLTTTCSLIGNSINIQPKQFDTSWTGASSALVHSSGFTLNDEISVTKLWHVAA